MNETFNSIWIECGLPRQKKILVCNIYRQWQLPNQGNDKTSASVTSQLERFVTFLDQWERAIATGREICVLGDFNLNFLNFRRPNLPVNSQCARLHPLVRELPRLCSGGGSLYPVLAQPRSVWSWPFLDQPPWEIITSTGTVVWRIRPQDNICYKIHDRTNNEATVGKEKII